MTFEEAGQHLSMALEAAVSRYGAMVRQVGRKYRLDDSDLDEVMQEVRIRLWRARGTSEMVGEANTSYIYRTASTAALDVLRRRRARKEVAQRVLRLDRRRLAGRGRRQRHAAHRQGSLAKVWHVEVVHDAAGRPRPVSRRDPHLVAPRRELHL